ncbi:CBS domain-containing protein [Streptomyces erythrochromogenes]|uniref:CBS domain-containing protein n=1 Tax=Streptomyces erythrochromogenes TaxID=285574 RepID=A0ABZ1QK25_9ACTN|nr:CBS domain-containing protein [Streptomyces erythrochromogenes]MCX5588591.1 CBS domain-containing protein [Streptomyces erythrochromogenes]
MKRLEVADLMTDEVVSVAPGTGFKDVAKLLAQYDISGVPVLDDEDHVVGVVPQTDLLAHTVSGSHPAEQSSTVAGPPSAVLRPDSEIRRRVTDEVLTEVLGVPTGDVDVHVVDGIVTLGGQVERRSQLPALLTLVEQLDGVVAVASRVTARTDDTASTHADHARHAMPW